MIYSMNVVLTADTKKNKVIIVTPYGKRLVFTPISRTSKAVFVVIDDVPLANATEATELLRRLVQSLYTQREVDAALRMEKKNAGNSSPTT